ncbi:MAG: hypothetical protein ACRD3W_19295 [Terriglobales bacterium]
MTDTTLTPERSAELLAKLRTLANGAAEFYGSGEGASLNRSGRLFVDAGDRLPNDLNRLLLEVIRGVNGGQQLFAQGAVFGMLTDEARLLVKAVGFGPAEYWYTVATAAEQADKPKLALDDIKNALRAYGLNPKDFDTSKVREVYFA